MVDVPIMLVIVFPIVNIVVPNGANHIVFVLFPELCIVTETFPFV